VSPPGPASLELADRLRAVESRDVTYLAPDFPVFWEEARGANVRDVDGNVYLDLTGGFGVSLLGHAPEAVRAAIHAQADVLIHGMGDVHPPKLKVALLERLAEMAPWGESRGVLSSSGSEAVEGALKTALVASGRPGILAFKGGYHGLTVGSLAATWRDHFRERFLPRLFGGVAFLDFPTDAESAARVLGEMEALLRNGTADGSAVGAVLIEPIQGRAGVRIPPDPFLGGLVELTRAAGAVSIFDEIFTGFGRAGALFYGPSVGAIPDLLCVGKSLGGGMPISACLGSASTMNAWPESTGEAVHTSTFLGHPLSCAAALAFLNLLEDTGAVGRARKLGKRIVAALQERLKGSLVVEVRGRGLLIGIELRGEPGIGARVAREALARGVLLLPAGALGEVVELAPPVTLTEAQFDAMMAVLVASVEMVQAPS
jgi:4-aminobutyrate aminotransferase / (S)-3-amino-2-methylpropionate transaminase / 5-aminovalerate transaminase